MGIFNFGKNKTAAPNGSVAAAQNQAALAELALNNISDGVMIVGQDGIIKFTNPAAAVMTGYGNPASTQGLGYELVLKLEDQEGRPVATETSPLAAAMKAGQPWSSRDYLLVTTESERRMAIAIDMVPAGGAHSDKVITFRDITKELEKENEQTEFISTASHEMRTPVASIEGYLGLAMNPQTATVDARAQQYLTAAHAASKHLGELFKDLLDVTKLDDGRLKPKLVPVEMGETVRRIADEYAGAVGQKGLRYSFGAADGGRQMDQLIYAAIDESFLREVLDNLIGNAIKYTPSGGAVWVNVRGDGDKVLINVTDSGIGIAADDLGHIFQKFYRVDNSQTRQIGGTGLGLYLVKSRVEAMNGRVWAESAFGDGSTFYVSLPRLSEDEYKKRLTAMQNAQAMAGFGGASVQQVASVGNVLGQNQPAVAQVPAQPAGPMQAVLPTQPVAPAQFTAPQQPTAPATPPNAPQPMQPPINNV